MAKRVLVVDDDVDFQEAAGMMLKASGYEVAVASSSAEALAVLGSKPVDLILLDVMMESDTAGFHLAYAIRDDQKLKDIPIVMLTSIEKEMGVELDPAKSGDYMPVDAYLRKPLDAKKLKETVARLTS